MMKLQEPPTISDWAGVIIGILSILAIIYLAIVVQDPGSLPVLTGVVGAATGAFYRGGSNSRRNTASGESAGGKPPASTVPSSELPPRA